MNADDILTAARERLAEIDTEVARLTEERGKLARMLAGDTTPAVVLHHERLVPSMWSRGRSDLD